MFKLPLNVLRFRKTPKTEGPPPKDAIDVSYDRDAGMMKAIDSDGNRVAFDGSGAVATDDLVTEPSNGAAAAGKLGQYVSSLVPIESTVAIPHNTAVNITSIELTPGDWDVWGNLVILNSTAVFTQREVSINTISATRLVDGTVSYNGSEADDVLSSLPAIPRQISLSVNTTIYLVAFALYSGSDVTGYGALMARRVR